MDRFSSRTAQVKGKVAELRDEYVQRHGCEPPAAVLSAMSQQATLATRAAKTSTGESQDERLERWERETRETVAGGLAELAREFAASRDAVPVDRWEPDAVIDRAVDAIAAKRSTFSRSDLMREVSDALPANLGVAPDRVAPLLDRLTDVALARVQATAPAKPDAVALPDEMRLENGDSVWERPGSAKFAAPGAIAEERENRRAAVRRGAFALSQDDANRIISQYAAAGRELGADQQAAVRGVLTSGAKVEVIAAAAGTGKSFALGAVNAAMDSQGKRVHGLAPSQVAADVLADEGLAAANVDKWLAAQSRLAAGRAVDGDSRFAMRPDETVVIDEAGMASRQQIAAVRQRCEAMDAKLLLVGDARQMGAVGAGGAFGDIADHGVRYEIAEVRRFAEAWERTASLGLRDGDPAALAEYQKHGRLIDEGTRELAEQNALRGWLADVLDGRDSVLVAATNDAANRLSGAARAELARVGRLDPGGPTVHLAKDGNTAGVGDLVQARRNAWDLADSRGRAAINRAMYRVVGVREDGGLDVLPIGGREDQTAGGDARFHMPAEYVQQNLALGYAATVHATQGRTLDTCHAIIDKTTSAAAAYVALTRGKLRNIAHVVTRDRNPDDRPGVTQTVEPRAARGVLEEILERDTEERSALQEMEREAEAEAGTFRNVGQLLSEVQRLEAGHTSTVLDRLTAEGVITEQDRIKLAADEATGAVDRILRSAELAGHDRDEVLRNALAGRDLSDARSAGQVLYDRIRRSTTVGTTPKISAFRDLIPAHAPEHMKPWLQERAERADDRRRELGSRTAEQRPAWATESLGAVPDDLVKRAEWEHRAGWAAAYRELADHDDEQDPLGNAPPVGLAEKHAIWRAAHEALDLPDAGADERAMTIGRLRNRVVAYEREKNWAPRWVGDEMGETERQAEARRVDHELFAARAAELEEEQERRELAAAAAEARREHEELAARAAQLEEADLARARWFAATAATRERHARATAELANRGIDLDDDTDKVTAEEWLAAHEQHVVEEDPVREVTETDVVEEPPKETALTLTGDDDQRRKVDTAGDGPRPDDDHEHVERPAESDADRDTPDRDRAEDDDADDTEPVSEPDDRADKRAEVDEPDPARAAADDDAESEDPDPAPKEDPVEARDDEPDDTYNEDPPAPEQPETNVPDIRETAERDKTEDKDESPRDRVPSADEARVAEDRAREALAEIKAREEEDRRREQEEAARRRAEAADAEEESASDYASDDREDDAADAEVDA